MIQKLITVDDEEIVSDSLWALKSIAQNGDETVIEEITRMDCTKLFIGLANCQVVTVKFPAIGLLGLLLSGSEDQILVSIAIPLH